MERLLSTAELAEILGTSPSALRVWRHRGQGPIARKYGRQVMYRPSDVDAWLESTIVGRPLEASA